MGWLLNMGHRVMMVHRMLHGEPAWPSWRSYGELLRHGLVTFAGMLFYYVPGLALLAAARPVDVSQHVGVGSLLLVHNTLGIPEYKAHYCRDIDAAEIFNP